MKFSRSIVRILSWAALFAESEIGQDFSEGTIGVQIPGLLKENGQRNNKGNVIIVVRPNEASDLMAELRTDPRDLTPAEMVRRTREVSNGVVSFKTSADSGSRTVKVPEDSWGVFLDNIEGKFEDATALLLEAERLTAELNNLGKISAPE
jgi:hypothetical protein